MTVIPFPNRERWRRELSSVPPPAVATDATADLVFSELLSREGELAAQAEAAADAGFPGQKETELDVVRALLRLILSPNVRMSLSRLQ
jgi:hypothetical protein